MTRSTPILGLAFTADTSDLSGLIECYRDELTYSRARGWQRLSAEGIAHGVDVDDWIDRVETFLTDWARRVSDHEFIRFGAAEAGNEVGYWIDAQSAIDAADCVLNDRRRGPPEVPKGFSGLLAHISDHGNVTLSRYSNGRRGRELFAVV